MKKIFLIFLLPILFSCSSDSDSPERFTLDTTVHLKLQNASGENLFNTPNFNPDDFRIFNIIDGQAEEVSNGNLDYPRNFMMIEAESGTVMRLFLNDNQRMEFPETIVKWNATQSDTLRAGYRLSTSSIIIEKVWLNGDLVWQAPGANQALAREITIVK
ncbi:hypothetical protein [Flavobacterium sp.]|uniref:hypothetical protein n=1 Tax=Flavobacterium sp. TaxID=239 RepID=UPI0012034D01|nr:hypothetical protein [Flavobacterium sp.]RZJ73245.1 MAG: hypothetical protein EOO49_02760 [Flavobacterium sp.]